MYYEDGELYEFREFPDGLMYRANGPQGEGFYDPKTFRMERTVAQANQEAQELRGDGAGQDITGDEDETVAVSKGQGGQGDGAGQGGIWGPPSDWPAGEAWPPRKKIGTDIKGDVFGIDWEAYYTIKDREKPKANKFEGFSLPEAQSLAQAMEQMGQTGYAPEYDPKTNKYRVVKQTPQTAPVRAELVELGNGWFATTQPNGQMGQPYRLDAPKVEEKLPTGYQVVQNEDGSKVILDAQGNFQQYVPRPQTPSLEDMMAEELIAGNGDGAQRLWDFKSQMTPYQQEQVALAYMQEGRAAFDQQLRYAQSPGDLLTLVAMQRGEIPGQATPGEYGRVLPPSRALGALPGLGGGPGAVSGPRPLPVGASSQPQGLASLGESVEQKQARLAGYQAKGLPPSDVPAPVVPNPVSQMQGSDYRPQEWEPDDVQASTVDPAAQQELDAWYASEKAIIAQRDADGEFNDAEEARLEYDNLAAEYQRRVAALPVSPTATPGPTQTLSASTTPLPVTTLGGNAGRLPGGELALAGAPRGADLKSFLNSNAPADQKYAAWQANLARGGPRPYTAPGPQRLLGSNPNLPFGGPIAPTLASPLAPKTATGGFPSFLREAVGNNVLTRGAETPRLSLPALGSLPYRSAQTRAMQTPEERGFYEAGVALQGLPVASFLEQEREATSIGAPRRPQTRYRPGRLAF